MVVLQHRSARTVNIVLVQPSGRDGKVLSELPVTTIRVRNAED